MHKICIILAFTFTAFAVIAQNDGNLIVEGKVGIGTSAVGKALEVYGNVVTKATDIGGTAGAFTAGTDGLVSFWTNANYSPTKPGSGWKRTMNLVGGNVGIGTTDPQYKLHVAANKLGFYTETSDYGGVSIWGLASGDLSQAVYGESNGESGRGVTGVARGINGRGIVGNASMVGSVGVLGGSSAGKGVEGAGAICDFDATGNGPNYCATSSKRWKHSIQKIVNPLYKLSKLRGVTFTWDNEHGGHRDIGFIAEEVGEILPQIVVYESNGEDALSMDYSMMTPLLVEAANAMRREYQAEISSLRQENELLRTRLEKIEALLKIQEVTQNTDL